MVAFRSTTATHTWDSCATKLDGRKLMGQELEQYGLKQGTRLRECMPLVQAAWDTPTRSSQRRLIAELSKHNTEFVCKMHDLLCLKNAELLESSKSVVVASVFFAWRCSFYIHTISQTT